MARSIANDLRRGTVSLVIDHYTVHHAPNTVSIHLLELDTNGRVVHGQDIDGVTVEDLGSTGDVSAAISDASLLAFATSVSGLPAAVDKPKPEPVADEQTIGAADVGTVEVK